MRMLTGGVPRGFKDGRSAIAREYRAYCLAVLRRLGPLSPDDLVLLRELGRASIELHRLSTDLEAARSRTQRKEAKSIRRQQATLRGLMLKLQTRLEHSATTSHLPESAAAWAARRNQGASA